MADVILVDYYSFTVKPQWQGGRPSSVTLNKGDGIEPLADSILGYDQEVARGKTLGAIGDDSILRDRVSVLLNPPPMVTAERLAAATPEELEQIVQDAKDAVLARSTAMGTMPSSVYDDSQLGKMSVEELSAVVNQFPSELPRVLQIEQARGPKARKGVLELDPNYSAT